MIRSRRALGAGLVACAGLLALPSAGHALSGVAITNDLGQAQPLAPGTTLRTMAPLVGPAFSANERYYKLTITSPTGEVDTVASCSSIASSTAAGVLPYKVRYQGPGAYNVEVAAFTQAQYDDTGCRGAQAGSFSASFLIQPAVSMGTFPGKVLTRKPSGRRISPNLTYAVPMNGNPGALSNDVVVNGPGLPAEGSPRTLDPATGAASVTFFEPGAYTLTPRATPPGSFAAPVIGPPLAVRVLDPFDLSAPGFIDSTGPVYTWSAYTRTKFMRGTRLRFQIRSKGAKKFRTVAKAKVRSSKLFKFRMKINKRGKYFYRIRFKGNKNVAGGTFKGSFRIKARRI